MNTNENDVTLSDALGDVPTLPEEFSSDRYQLYIAKELAMMLAELRGGTRAIRPYTEDAIKIYLSIYANATTLQPDAPPTLIESDTGVGLKRCAKLTRKPENLWVRLGASMIVALLDSRHGNDSLFRAIEASAKKNQRKLTDEIVSLLTQALTSNDHVGTRSRKR